MELKKKYLKYKYKYINSKYKIKGGDPEKYKLFHLGNTITTIKYAMHCKNEDNYHRTINILKKIGFTIKLKEDDELKHTFLYPPDFFNLSPDSFMFILIIKDDGNNQKLITGKPSIGPHIGFKVKKSVLKYLIEITYDEKIMIVNKPDETSLFIELPCGEVIEISG